MLHTEVGHIFENFEYNFPSLFFFCFRVVCSHKICFNIFLTTFMIVKTQSYEWLKMEYFAELRKTQNSYVYISYFASNKENKDTLFTPTSEVEENRVPLFS